MNKDTMVGGEKMEPLGPVTPKRDYPEYVYPFYKLTPEDTWEKVPGKPGLYKNLKGQYKYISTTALDIQLPLPSFPVYPLT